MRHFGRKLIASLVIAIVVVALSAPTILWNPLESIHLRLMDGLYARNEASDQIVIIAIDEKSISGETGLGSFKNWPRSFHAELIQKLQIHEPVVIGFDVAFSSHSQGLSELRIQQLVSEEKSISKKKLIDALRAITIEGEHPDDMFLQQEISNAPIVLAEDLVIREEDGNVLYTAKSPTIFEDVTTGFAKLTLDKDEVIRRFAVALTRLDEADPEVSFAFRLAQFKNNELEIFPEEIGRQRLIDFAAPTGGYKRISFLDVLTGNFDPKDIKDKIVLIGATASILQDVRLAPNSTAPMPGVEFHANIIQQLLEGRLLVEQTILQQLGLITVISFCVSLLMVMLPMVGTVIILIAGLVAYAFVARLLFRQGFVLNMIYPFLALVASFFGVIIYHYFTELREKRQTRMAFGHYVNKEVVNEILKNPDALKLGGARKEISVLFTDIVDFTTIAEKLSPEDVTTLLNEYMDVMGSIVLENGGTLDKFEGDAVMAFFGAPLDQPDHAKMACEVALEMHAALAHLHEKWHREGKPLLTFCVGIATGEAIVGNLGSHERFDYTAVGDTINLGARLESVNRVYGTSILVNADTMEASKDQFDFRKVDHVRVKGKTKPVMIYELLDSCSGGIGGNVKFLHDFELGMQMYEKRSFVEAKSYFGAAHDEVLSCGSADPLTEIYLQRCEYFIKNPPSADWDMVLDVPES